MLDNISYIWSREYIASVYVSNVVVYMTIHKCELCTHVCMGLGRILYLALCLVVVYELPYI